tara:strand:+ start:3130 stop:3429 length:300 start_codon:yes stop_codon:yes gene_type:complete
MNLISKSVYNDLIKMFKGHDEDFDLAFQCFINSNYYKEHIIACIITRRLTFEKRLKFKNEYNKNQKDAKLQITNQSMILKERIIKYININDIKIYKELL